MNFYKCAIMFGFRKSGHIYVIAIASYIYTVPLDLNFTHARAQKATARNIHGNAPE